MQLLSHVKTADLGLHYQKQRR